MKTPLTFGEASAIVNCGPDAPFLRELREGGENELRLTIRCARPAPEVPPETTGRPPLDRILRRCTPILPDPAREMEIVFPDYLLYQVRNESFCSFDPSEVRQGRYLCIFQRSKLLEHLTAVTDSALLPAPWTHYGIFTQNQIIDVISQTEPQVFGE